MATEEGEGMDNLSKLPEGIIHHILSFLPTQEAAQTSLLSKAWLSTWRRRPTLDFDCKRMVVQVLERTNKSGDAEERVKKTREALEYIISTLDDRYCKQEIGLETFNFRFKFVASLDPYFLVHRCVELAVRNGVRNLDMSIDGGYEYALPQAVLEAKSLVDLSLGFCCLEHQNMVMCCNLKRLCLDRVSLDEVVFGNIMGNCPLIEILEIRHCVKIRNFKVPNLLKNLKQLKAMLRFCQSIEVAAPNLESIDCTDDWSAFKQLTSLIHLRASGYANLKSLLLCNVGIDDSSLVNFAAKFPQVEYLSIQQCQKLQRIKISSRSLTDIELLCNRGLKEAEFDVPNIALFVYHGYELKNCIMPELSFTAASGCSSSRCRWVSCIHVMCLRRIGTSWFLKLKKFLKSLNQSEIYLALGFEADVAFNVASEKINTNSAAFFKVQEIREVFIMVHWRGLLLGPAGAILDGIFWTCRPRTISYCPWYRCQYRYTELLYKKLMLIRNPGHSDFQPIKFWQDDLVKVSDIEIFQCPGPSYYKRGPGLQLPLDLDWNKFSEVLKPYKKSGRDGISFNLEWETSDWPQSGNKLTN